MKTLHPTKKTVNGEQKTQSLREFLQTKIEESKNDEPDEIALAFNLEARAQSERRITSASLSALSVFASELCFSDKSKVLLMVLVGLSEGNLTFNTTYKTIYFHLRKYDPNLKTNDGELPEKVRQIVRRYIEALRKDQEKAGVILARITPGRKEGEARIPTAVELPLLDFLAEINLRAKMNRSYSKKSRSIRAEEARRYAAELSGKEPPQAEAVQESHREKQRKLMQKVKRTAGMIASTIADLKAQDYTDEGIRKQIAHELSKALEQDPKTFLQDITLLSELPQEIWNLLDNLGSTLYPDTEVDESGAKEHSGGATVDFDGEGAFEGVNIEPLETFVGVKTDTCPAVEAPPNQEFRGGVGVDYLPSEPILTGIDVAERVREACQMIEAFESVDALHFEVTITNQDGHKVKYQGGLTGDELKGRLKQTLSEYESRELNVIVRPSGNLALVQLDDLDRETVGRVAEYSFLILQTSPANYQSWVAVKGADQEIVRRFKKGVGADMSASGATRIAGSRNFKPKHAPGYPRIRLINTKAGRVLSIHDLEASGLLAPPESKPAAPAYAPIAPTSRSRTWPDYERCLADAPKAKNHDGKDRSQADWMFCLLSIARGFDVQETANELMRVSEKATEQGSRYAFYTATRAGHSVERSIKA
jgi:hypothetical protein